MDEPNAQPIVIVRLWQLPLASCRCKKRLQARISLIRKVSADPKQAGTTVDARGGLDAKDGQTLD